MPSVQGHDGATGCSGIMEDRGVGVALVALSVLHHGQNIVPKCAESLDDRQRYVFVRVESGHGLVLFVLRHEAVDFLAVPVVIGPSVVQVFHAKGRIGV